MKGFAKGLIGPAVGDGPRLADHKSTGGRLTPGFSGDAAAGNYGKHCDSPSAISVIPQFTLEPARFGSFQL